MSTKESEHIKPALDALKAGNYRSAVNSLQLAVIDAPAGTSDSPEDVRLAQEVAKITRMRTLWLLMIAQRLDDRFDEADETLRLIGFYLNDPTIAELVSAELFDILLVNAKEKNDQPAVQILLAAQPVR